MSAGRRPCLACWSMPLCSSHKTVVGSQFCSTRGFFQMVVSDSVLYHQMVVSDSAIVLPDSGVWQCFVSQMVVSDSVLVLPDGDICYCLISWCYCVTRWWSNSVIVSLDGGVWQCHCVTIKMLSDSVIVSPWRCYLTLSLCHQMVVPMLLCYHLGSDSVIVSPNGSVIMSTNGVWQCHCVIRWCLMVSLCHKMMLSNCYCVTRCCGQAVYTRTWPVQSCLMTSRVLSRCRRNTMKSWMTSRLTKTSQSIFPLISLSVSQWVSQSVNQWTILCFQKCTHVQLCVCERKRGRHRETESCNEPTNPRFQRYLGLYPVFVHQSVVLVSQVFP